MFRPSHIYVFERAVAIPWQCWDRLPFRKTPMIFQYIINILTPWGYCTPRPSPVRKYTHNIYIYIINILWYIILEFDDLVIHISLYPGQFISWYPHDVLMYPQCIFQRVPIVYSHYLTIFRRFSHDFSHQKPLFVFPHQVSGACDGLWLQRLRRHTVRCIGRGKSPDLGNVGKVGKSGHPKVLKHPFGSEFLFKNRWNLISQWQDWLPEGAVILFFGRFMGGQK